MLLLLVTLLATPPAPAPAPAPEVRERIEPPPHTWVALRGGLASGGSAPVQMCAAVTPVAAELAGLSSAFGVEACGNGSGFLHGQDAPEIAHFRARWRVTSVETELGFVQPMLSAGFAELQVGPDAPGFYFFDTGPSGVEAAGPELGASLGWALPLGLGIEAVAELSFNLAHFSQAPRLAKPLDPFQPSVALSAGLGW